MPIFNSLRKFLTKTLSLPNCSDILDIQKMMRQVEEGKLLTAKLLVNEIKAHGPYEHIHEAEFKIFSQFGDDGILQYFIHQVEYLPHTFIEFGVANYSEANTRFLLLNDNWKGLIIDSSQEAMNSVRREDIYWRYDLTAIGAFITRENVNQLFRDNGFSGEIGLLSVDIDGNDYWVWEAIDSVNAVIVTVEYNSVFGAQYAISVPYDPAFYRTKAHYSNLYWGASLKALCLLAEKKGYAFVGCNSNGNNAHFVRKDKLGKISPISCQKGYVCSKYRESRNEQGNLTFLLGEERLKKIKDMEVFDLEKQILVRLGDLMRI